MSVKTSVKTATPQRVAVAMSGGVDSAVAAALLIEQGFDVFGITLLLRDDAGSGVGSACEDARKVADALGIEHHIVDCRAEFSREVIDYFVDSYMRAETPLPCAVCNRRIKFGRLVEEARALGATAVATGHYAKIEARGGVLCLLKGADETRDQSYFLFATTKEQLSFLMFPLGGMENKQATRAVAERLGLSVASKPDSQDICFVPDGDYAGFVRSMRPNCQIDGDFVDSSGRVLGRHSGFINYTIGQRRGLNINRCGDNNEPLYVTSVDAKNRAVVVGERDDLASTEVHLRDVNWLGEPVSETGIRVSAKLRSAQPPLSATFFFGENGAGRLVFDVPVFGVAPGQAGVIYENDRLLGGGWICLCSVRL